MKERKESKTKTYEVAGDFLVDVVDTVDSTNGFRVWEAWLYRDGADTKMFMFGLQKSDVPTISDFTDIVESWLPEYYHIYEDETGEEIDDDK